MLRMEGIPRLDRDGNDPRTFAESAGWKGFFEWNDLTILVPIT